MRLLGPLRERDFALMWVGLAVSLLGDGIYFVAIAWAVYAISNEPAALSLVGLAWSAGMVAFLLTGGVLADRRDKRHVMIAADLIRLVALAIAGALSIGDALELWHLVLLALAYGIGEALVGPALGSIVPELVPDAALVQANALTQTLRPIDFRLAGPAVGGVAVAALGTGGAFLLDAGTFVVSIACLAAMSSRPAAVLATTGTRSREQLLEAWRFVKGETWLWATLLASSVSLLAFYGPVEVLVPYIIKNDLDADAAAFGAVLAANGAGSVLGALVVGQRGIPRREITALYVVWGVGTFAIAGYALASAVWQLMALSFVFGILLGLGMPIWATLMQVRVPQPLRGRVASLDWLVSIGLTPLSFALTGPVAAAAGAEATLVGAGVAGGVVTLALLVLVPGLRAEDGGVARAEAQSLATSRPMSDEKVG
jgi:DHA3 family tetracycline resistance protein-like MFS transporter